MNTPSDDAICAWLNGVTYRPGWGVRFGLRLDDGRAYVVIEASEPDVCNPGGTFTTAPLFRVPDGITQSDFYDWLIDVCIPGVEQHERWEWFRIDGKHWRDPHAPGMPAFTTDFTEYST